MGRFFLQPIEFVPVCEADKSKRTFTANCEFRIKVPNLIFIGVSITLNIKDTYDGDDIFYFPAKLFLIPIACYLLPKIIYRLPKKL